MGLEFSIRKLYNNETENALELVWSVFQEFEAPDYTQEGADEFYKSIHDEKYLSMLSVYGAFSDDKLVGVIATRNSASHIALFFVTREYQKNGIGKTLFKTALSDNHTGVLTVNSSPFAVPVYRRLGFAEVDSEQAENGIRFTPMKYEFSVE